MNNIAEVVKNQHTYFKNNKSRDLSFRIEQLKKLKSVLKKHEDHFMEAIKKDFQKPALESYGTEIGFLYSEIDHILKHIKKWAQTERVWGSFINFPSRNYIYRQPYGVALVIGAWNYPLLLSLSPALGAIAAGNCTIIKPSEISRHTSPLLADIINSNFEEGYLRVIEGAAETTQELLDEPLDYIFFTGSTRVGKIIMGKAAEQLTPLTLELGGKSPAIVHSDADVSTAARRIVWGKFINAGQTCVAPDYVYVHKDLKESLLKSLKQEITGFYGTDPQKSPDYARIINSKHFNRLKGYLENGTIVTGGQTDEQELFIAPTILEDIAWEDKVMQEEIFGPLLPVMPYENLNEIMNTIREKPTPLSLYLFTGNKDIEKKIIKELPFGGGCINDTIAHLGNLNLPFGGLGQSGFGNYHGKSSFDIFSHKKSIMKKPTWLDNPMRYAPYSGKLKWLKKLFN
ncbi:MAG TPA: aldehyde dehydrogenase [Halalkalibaculum sp.]|nr:aldehyde dehydrogenase [Halalkalibaculum sp.]